MRKERGRQQNTPRGIQGEDFTRAGPKWGSGVRPLKAGQGSSSPSQNCGAAKSLNTIHKSADPGIFGAQRTFLDTYEYDPDINCLKSTCHAVDESYGPGGDAPVSKRGGGAHC
jgi:hypothetical protein